MPRTPLLLALSILAYGASASAQQLDGRFHLGLGTRLAYVDYQSLEYDPELDGLSGGPDQRISAGFGEGWLSTTFGYGFARRWVIDLRASFQHLPSGYGDSDAQTGFELGPALRHVFAPAAVVRPFMALGAHGGALLGGDYGYWAVGGELGGGVQVLLAERLTLDPQLSLSYDHRRQQSRQAGTTDELVGNSVSLAAHLMLSAWL